MSLNFTIRTRTISERVFAGTAMQAATLPGSAFVQPGHLLVVYKGQFKWTVRRRVACRVRVSCLQQPGKQNKKQPTKQTTNKGLLRALKMPDHRLPAAALIPECCLIVFSPQVTGPGPWVM